MTPISVNVDIDDKGNGIDIQVRSEKSLHIAQYIEILEGVLAAMKRKHGGDINDFEELKKSGKLVELKRPR